MLRRGVYVEKDETELVLGRVTYGGSGRRGAFPVCLVGRLLSDKAANTYALVDVMIKSIKAKGRLTARDWGNRLLVFSFELIEDRKWVLLQQPWHFDGALFLIKPIVRSEQPSPLTLSEADFCVRAHEIPLMCQNLETIEVVAGRLGHLVAYENPNPLDPNEFLRLKVKIDVTKPLRHGLNIYFDGEKLYIPFTYEALPAFCFCCGVIGHFYKSCKYVDRDLEVDPKDFIYGSNLKASMQRRQRGVKPTIVYTECGTQVHWTIVT
ncbi:hypothetical protein ACS0TY_012695 [Phlomoides rotata]